MLKKPIVLIVDDDAAVRLALALRLRAAGFDVLTAHHPDAAAPIALRGQPDLILLDIDMPRYTGFEFHECLRFAERGRAIPVIYLSGHDSQLNRALALQHGAAGFVAKPYDADRLIATIRTVTDAQAVRV